MSSFFTGLQRGRREVYQFQTRSWARTTAVQPGVSQTILTGPVPARRRNRGELRNRQG